MKKQDKKKRRRLSIQPLEHRRVLAASLGWDGPGLGGATLTYTISGSPDSLTESETAAAIETALDAWSEAADITFIPTSQTGLRDSIDISFRNLDGPGGTLAQAYLPDDVNPARIAGDIEFDLGDQWEIGNAQGNSAFDLVWVAAHEIGHSLGLEHIESSGAILSQFVSPNQQFVSLTPVDIAAVREIYAPANNATASISDGDQSESSTDTTSDSSDDGGDTEPTDMTSTNTTPSDDTPTEEENNRTNDINNQNDRNQRRRRRGGGSFGGWGRFGQRLGSDISALHNLYSGTDVNNDDSVTPRDALLVINELNRIASAMESMSDAMCDANGDGEVTPMDALLVINELAQAENGDETLAADSEGEIVTVGTDTPDSAAPDSDTSEADPTDTTIDNDIETDMADTPTSEPDTLPPTTADDSESEPTDEIVDVVPDGQIDNNGVEPDTNETTDDDDEIADGDENEDDSELCHDERYVHSRGYRGHRFFNARDSQQWFEQFDSNNDGSLTEDELPGFLWQHLLDQGSDENADGMISVEEIDAAIIAARNEKFMQRDSNGDGLLQESEVSSRTWNRISAADADGDAGVSMSELASWITERHAENSQAGAEESENERIRHRDRLFARFGTRR